ncbi:hypothetical protein SAMN05421798_1721 [Pseudovibrio axinellae]|nr:hypothetical protein SAMN05421798_1721 [Pseudovibrio axinellae]
MLLERGLTLSYETIRKWGIKFGQLTLVSYAAKEHKARISGILMRL